jgi:hypothetical protein
MDIPLAIFLGGGEVSDPLNDRNYWEYSPRAAIRKDGKFFEQQLRGTRMKITDTGAF